MMDIDPPGNQVPNIYSQAFDRWKKVYEQLASTFDSFLAETIKLDLTLQLGAREWPGLEESLAYVDAAFASLDTWPSRMCDARTTLGAIRNRSRSLVPLSKLPNEVVLHILSLADTDCITKYRYSLSENEVYRPSPLVSASVASKWLRSITSSAPSLWTHIDLAVGEPYEAACLYRGRSHLRHSEQKPLYVHVIHTNAGRRATGVINLLAPHAHRIVSLDLQTIELFAKEIVLRLFGNVSSCQIKEFCLNDRTEDEEPDPMSYREFFGGRLGKFFRSLQIIAVCGPSLPLDSVAFRGLTALKLTVYNAAGLPPTLAQLRSVLAACPELRALTTHFYWFQTNPEVPVEPVLLPKLELLDLRRTDTDELLGLVSCITPRSSALAFSVSLKDMFEGEITRLQHFIKESNVTRLFLDNFSYNNTHADEPFPHFTTNFPAIQELALAEYDLQRLSVGRLLDAFPSLRTLHLLRCDSDSNSYRQLRDSSSVLVVYADESSYEKLSGVDSSAQYRSYPSMCQGEGYLEWPLEAHYSL